MKPRTVYRFVRRNFTRCLARYKVRGKRILIDVMRPSRISPAVIAAALSACAQEPEALNSERIEQRFGSYGIAVLSHEAGIRRSSLYSEHDESRICRTYAVVRFVDESTPRVAQAHADVVAGQSIGSTFRSDGWQIGKVTLHVGSLKISDPAQSISKLMRLPDPVELGVHAYQLVLERDDQTIDYATIVETHHPDYLSSVELEVLYGAAIKSDLDEQEIQNLSTLIMDID
ncbi:MAG: hypothetical protein ACR2QL_03860 [Woeseiaceae bacterium]